MLAGELQRDKISANFLKVKGLQKIMLFWLPRLGSWCWKTFNFYYFFFVWKQVSYFLVSVLYILKTLVKKYLSWEERSEHYVFGSTECGTRNSHTALDYFRIEDC